MVKFLISDLAQMAVEVKQGISQLELLYEEITREELAKQQRREKLRLKRKKKKERRYETEEKENSCDVRLLFFFSKNLFNFTIASVTCAFFQFYQCSSTRESGSEFCICAESKPTTQNIDRHKVSYIRNLYTLVVLTAY